MTSSISRNSTFNDIVSGNSNLFFEGCRNNFVSSLTLNIFLNIKSRIQKSGIDKIPTQDEYKNALNGDTDLDKKIIKLGELNELAYEHLILLMNTNLYVGKVAF